MLIRLRAAWLRLHESLWFVPSLLVVAGIALATLLVDLSARVDRQLLYELPRLFGASADSSRAMLGAIAGSMITVAGLSFSLTMLAVTQASSQYTPRILRNFMRDRANQTVLGVFVGVFAYCLVVLRTIRGGSEEGVAEFVPSIAVLAAVLLAIVAVAVLIFFVHHIAASLQASTILRRVARETTAAVDRLFPDELGEAEPPDEARDAVGALPPPAWHAVPSPATGYVQAVDGDGLLRVARDRRYVIRMERAIGEFVVEGMPLASLAAAGRRAPNAAAAEGPPGEDERAVAAHFTVGEYRTVAQDAGFGVRQLVDIALKALSPGVNDTTTAVSCVDYLGAILVRLARRRVAPRTRGADGALYVIARGPTFASLLGEAIDEIRQNAAANVSVLARLLEVLGWVGRATRAPGRRQMVATQIALVLADAERAVPAEHDRARLRAAAASATAW